MRGAEENDERTIANLLTDQVECANVLVLNKVDLMPDGEAERLEQLLRTMNPKAKLIRSNYSKVDLKEILNTRSFNMKEAQNMPGWYQELKGNHTPETLEYDISSFVFRSQRPFHPTRLTEIKSNFLENVVRSKGMLWVAGSDAVMVWNQAGATIEIGPGRRWVRKQDRRAERKFTDGTWLKDTEWGERRTELVLIGRGLDEPALRKRLDDALLTDEEMKMSPDEWRKWENPFDTRKDDQHHEDHHEHQHHQQAEEPRGKGKGKGDGKGKWKGRSPYDDAWSKGYDGWGGKGAGAVWNGSGDSWGAGQGWNSSLKASWDGGWDSAWGGYNGKGDVYWLGK